jgi:hypothetical protein
MPLIRLMIGLFVLLHGLVHVLYVAHSRRLIELRPEMSWPDGSWAFSKLVEDPLARQIASVLYALAAVGFVASGAGLLLRQSWWRPVAVGAAALSSAIIILFWDGRLRRLSDQGVLALLINAAILGVVLLGGWRSVVS